MRVKLRPGTHFTAVPQGVYFSRAGASFILNGPPALYALLDAQVGRLTTGTDADELVLAVGDEALRPVLDRVLEMLVQRDVLLDLDAVSVSPPDPATAARYAEVLAFLEASCADPYRVFADLRAIRVAVLGAGPAVILARRALARYGIGELAESSSVEAAVLVDDAQYPLDLNRAARELPAELVIVPVHAGQHVALVGAPVRAGAGCGGFTATCVRAAAWASADAELRAPRPVSAILAGSLAARALLASLAGVDSASASATVVHGRGVQTHEVPLTAAAPDGPQLVVRGVPDEADPAAEEPSASQILEDCAPLTARWTGLMRRGHDLELAQLPLSLATVDALGSDPIAGWGGERAQAVLHALLSALRRTVVPHGEGYAAAGITPTRWLLDGVLRVLGDELLAGPPDRTLDWDDLTTRSQRSLWHLLGEYFDRPVRVALRAVEGANWTLATAQDTTTGERFHEWGPTPHAAAYSALCAAVAAAQADPPVRALLAHGAVGTQVLERLSGAQLAAGARQLDKLLADRGQQVSGDCWTGDPMMGDLPLVCGRVWLS